ncbi:tyrosine protein kinase [Thermococcus argininiproducens]|uniref:non-specific serine/threonine protein kinase n=1 Tax=Thermococcus argininiproducens TaxID=2866384 RepID=A0A9E7MBF9_9EURY|nr:serine/threonine-protein kinase RIO2 [Thermococcus argininiproducens]USH00704.1 tyrosine protein kinase [Thermococcus argininiproducens]
MVSKLLALEVYPNLRDLDFKVLRGVELNMRHYEWVPLENIAKFAKVDIETASHRLGKLDNWGLVRRRSDIGYIGYQLTIHGYDALVIRAFAQKGVIKAISQTQIGVGKEADVYIGITPSEEKVAVKFNRIGRTSYTRIKLYRPDFIDKRHISWLYISRLVAQREYEALQLLNPIAKVPKPIAWNRHAIVMEFIEGVELIELTDTDLTREEALEILNKVLEEYKKIVEFGIIHSDMSLYNIVLKSNGDILIIDWPQYLTTGFPDAKYYLERDLQVLLNSFKKKWGVKLNWEEVWEEFEAAFKMSLRRE